MQTGWIFIRYFCVLLLFLVAFHQIGRRLFPNKPSNRFYGLFLLLLSSLILFSSLFSIIQARFLTIQLLFLPWLIFLWLEEKKTNTPEKSGPLDTSHILALLAAILLIFTWNFLGRVSGGAFPYVIPPGTALAPNDIHIYSLRSYYLAESGWENYFGVYNLFDPNFHGVNPYHYLELWLSSGITWLFGGLNILNLSLITGSLFQFICLLGILAIMERFFIIRWHHILLAFSGLFIGGIYLFYSKLGFPAFGLSMMTYRFKMIAYYPFILGMVLACLQNHPSKALLFLLALPVATFTAMPAVLGTILIIVALGYLFNIIDRKNLGFAPWYGGILFVGFALFYALASAPEINSTFAVEESEVMNLFSSDLLIPRLSSGFKSFFYVLSHALILYWPFCFLGWWLKPEWKSWNLLWWLSGSILLSGALAFALLADFAQATQLFYNTGISILNVLALLMFILICSGYKSLSKVKRLGLISIFLITISTQFFLLSQRHLKPRWQKHYSENYLLEIQNFIKSGKASPFGGAVKGTADYHSDFSKMTAGYVLGYYLQYMRDGYTTISMSDFEIPINKGNERNNIKDIQSGAFYQFVARQKKDGSFLSLAQSQFDFVRDHQINFVILSANAELPSIFEPEIEQVIEDSVSGERFLLLKDF